MKSNNKCMYVYTFYGVLRIFHISILKNLTHRLLYPHQPLNFCKKLLL